MYGKREKPRQIISNHQLVEVLQGQAAMITEAVGQIGVTQQSFFIDTRSFME